MGSRLARLDRFHDPVLENPNRRGTAFNIVTAAVLSFSCRYLSHAIDELRPTDPAVRFQLSPRGWDRINGDYV
ncbi:hypothetical protein VQ042_19060 [Aurantimonas sp. A2-1-M11]|uniref:hypothetical protein n=1 Tax=Aurantimonas sp. A2-1-M11 TaxID=3113712 RepID=UPI002F945FD3